MTKNRFRSRRTLHKFAISVNCMYAAKAAAERASNAGVMCGSSPAEEGRPQVLLDGHSMKRRPGKRIGPFHEALRVMTVQAKQILVRQPENSIEVPLAAKCRDQFEQRIFPLAAHNIVHVARVQRRVAVRRWEIATPDNRKVGALPADFLATGHRGCHLWTGHDR